MKAIFNLLAISLSIFLLSGCEAVRLRIGGSTPATIKVKGKTGYVDGTLGKFFYKIFKKTIEQHPELETIVVLDVPGSIDDHWNVKYCLLLNEKGLNTQLLSNSIVASGGTDLFASGKKLILAEGARIDVHSWSDGSNEATDYAKNHVHHKMFLDLYKKVGIDTTFYWFTLKSASADKIHFMTKAEINIWEVNCKMIIGNRGQWSSWQPTSFTNCRIFF